MILQSGYSFGRYVIQKRIGQGGMAVVYKAFDPELNRDVAIKIIRTGAFPPDTLDRAFLRFKREAKVLAQLNHANIVKVLDYGESDGAPYLVMEFLEGLTLKTVRKPMSVENAVKLIRPIVNALAYIHRQGLLHRDVKPSNIMFTEDGRVMLMDFGIAKWIESSEDQTNLTATGIGIGTPEYMAPEQGWGKTIDRRADEYALSVVFYELITGRKPFRGATPIEVLTKQAVEPFPDPRMYVPELNPSVKRFFDRALAKNPENRYATTRDFLRDLDGLGLQSIANRAKGKTVPRLDLFIGSSTRSADDGGKLLNDGSDLNDKLSVNRKNTLWQKICLGAGALIFGFLSIYFSHSLNQSELMNSFEFSTDTAESVLIRTLESGERGNAAQVKKASDTMYRDMIYHTAEVAMTHASNARETAASMRQVMTESARKAVSTATAAVYLPSAMSAAIATFTAAPSPTVPTLDADCRLWLPNGETGKLISFYGRRLKTDDVAIPNRILGSIAVIEPPFSANEREWVVKVVDYRQKWDGGSGVDETRYPCSWIDGRIHCGPFDFYYSALTDNAEYAYDSYPSVVLVYPKGRDCNVYKALIPYYQFNQARNAAIQLESTHSALFASDGHNWGTNSDSSDENGNGSGSSTFSPAGSVYSTKPESVPGSGFGTDFVVKP